MAPKDHLRQNGAASPATLHRPSLATRFATLFPLCLLLSATTLWADPEPGDIFREYTWTAPAGRQMVIDPNAYGPLLNPPIPVQTFHIGDLTGAVRAEIYLEIWSGDRRPLDSAFTRPISMRSPRKNIGLAKHENQHVPLMHAENTP